MSEITNETVGIKNLCYACAGRLPKHWEKTATIVSSFRCDKCGRVGKKGGVYKYHYHEVDEEE